MFKRNATPLSVNHRKKFKEKIPHPKPRKNTSIESSRLILPLLKDNIDENNKNHTHSHKNLNPNKSGIKTTGKKRLNINKVVSPIKTELEVHKKRGSRTEQELDQKIVYKLSEKTNRIIDRNSNEKNLNNFNRCNARKSSNIKTELLPTLYNNHINSNVKCPLIETNLYKALKSDKKINNKIKHHKFKSDTLLNSEFTLEMKKYATHSRKGTESEGKSKENNQDISVILNDICDIENYNIYGIMDGHGSNGHLVSNFVKEKVIEYFSDRKLYKKKRMSKSISFIEMDNTGKIYEKLNYNNHEIIRNFYKKVNDELYNTKFDVHFSGCTCVLVFQIGQKIICSNVGDSRAILVKKKINKNNDDIYDIKYDYVQMSYDHKPENKEERERIEKLGGEVAQEFFIEKQDVPAGPFRVWNKGCDYPGIAISRSLGDKIAELIGVISEPDILEFDIDDNCKYIIMGSDGLFDYLSNDDIMGIAGPPLRNHNPDRACLDVVEKAAQLFKEKEDRIDDITINIKIL